MSDNVSIFTRYFNGVKAATGFKDGVYETTGELVSGVGTLLAGGAAIGTYFTARHFSKEVPAATYNNARAKLIAPLRICTPTAKPAISK